MSTKPVPLLVGCTPPCARCLSTEKLNNSVDRFPATAPGKARIRDASLRVTDGSRDPDQPHNPESSSKPYSFRALDVVSEKLQQTSRFRTLAM